MATETAHGVDIDAVDAPSREYELTAAQFAHITSLLKAHSGIRMRAGKEGLVRARLAKRLRALRLSGFDEYLALVEHEGDGVERAQMIDALTTNMTSFLRESAHFDYIRAQLLPSLRNDARLWSAGCASGQEPYTLAMLLASAGKATGSSDASILATDISERVLATARTGTYDADLLAAVPADWRERFWIRETLDARDVFTATSQLRRHVRFERLNLIDDWPMAGGFDAILCRNVMIYFEKATQQRLVDRFWAMLRPGGHLFVGHSEGLSGLAHRFRYVLPAIYVK
jgi:chemotaxis protein methyltransferase CheR